MNEKTNFLLNADGLRLQKKQIGAKNSCDNCRYKGYHMHIDVCSKHQIYMKWAPLMHVCKEWVINNDLCNR